MPRLILQFEDQVLNKWSIGLMTTIGRLPDNNVVIDNPAVSGHHACLFRDGEQFVVEDLGSRNGTFVNDRRVTREPLKHGDVVLVGKHALVFDEKMSQEAEDSGGEAAATVLAPLGDTVYLDTNRHRALLAQLGGDTGRPEPESGPPAPPAVLRVVQGRTEQSEYVLEARTSFIGKSESAQVRLRGWFKPKMALAIVRNKDGYAATVLGGKATINSEPLTGRHQLKHGDVLGVSGLVLEFHAQ